MRAGCNRHPRARPLVSDAAPAARRSPKHRRRHGYVLIVTLALLVLATSLLVGVGRAARRHAVEAWIAQDEIRRRWGAASSRSAVLPHAEAILAAQEDRRHGPVPRFHAAVQLSGQTFELIVADEQAKANLNVLLVDASVPIVENRLRQSLSGTGVGSLVKVRPSIFTPLKSRAPASAQSITLPSVAAPQWLSGPGQVFDDLAPERLCTPGFGGIAPGDLFTCWGAGAINLRRVSEPALKLAGPGLTSAQIRRLLDGRNVAFSADDAPIVHPASPDPTPHANAIEQAMEDAGIGMPERKGLAPLANQTACHSLWVISHTRRRIIYEFTVLDTSDENRPHTESFSW
jgi:hypothetical protein